MDEGPYLLVIDSEYYADVSEELVKGALAEIGKSGGTYTRVSVPGAFEIPGAIRMAVRSLELVGGRRRFDGYVALGCAVAASSLTAVRRSPDGRVGQRPHTPLVHRQRP